MTAPILRSCEAAEDAMAELFDFSESGAGGSGHELSFEVREDKCFPDGKWLSIGRLALYPESQEASSVSSEGSGRLLNCLRYGFFEWYLPSRSDFEDTLQGVLGGPKKSGGQSASAGRSVVEVSKAVVLLAIRCGLAHPVFDAAVVAAMPFTKPVSVVVDTSAVLQGGLDFLVRHLAPQARIKVPALVHMEILNLGERYFSLRRRGKRNDRILREHVMSQAAQRVLLRLELDERVEFERPRLGADPLRGIVQTDSDPEDKNLGLQKVQKSFADRLILETAVQHRDRVGPGHSVMLMTADQGLARMAVAEGLQPLYFTSDAPMSLFGSSLSGVVFGPFPAGARRLAGVSVASLLWEAAGTFGGARLVQRGSGSAFEVVALGQDEPWQAFQLSEDLQWTRGTAAPGAKGGTAQEDQRGEKVSEVRSTGATRARRGRRRLTGVYTFSLPSMLRLVGGLYRAGSLSTEEGMTAAGVGSESAFAEYGRFLLAGDFASRQSGIIRKRAALDQLVQSMMARDWSAVYRLLREVHSFHVFVDALRVGEPRSRGELALRGGAYTAYSAMAEVATVGLRVAGEGIFGTFRNPSAKEFSRLSLTAYEAVRGGEELALTGLWLEYLARNEGVHPVHARERLAEAHQAGYVRRFFEGSTPDTRYEDRTLQVLDLDRGMPTVRTVNLYHGDFLMPGRAAVGIRLVSGGGAQ